MLDHCPIALVVNKYLGANMVVRSFNDLKGQKIVVIGRNTGKAKECIFINYDHNHFFLRGGC